MARVKQPPVKRESSSEFFNKQTASWEGSNGKQQVVNGRATKDNATAVPIPETKDAGVVQLVIAVAGIYASL